MRFTVNFKNEITWRYKELKRGIINLIRWFPVIWKDRDWDNYYLEELIMTKLQYMAAHFENEGRHVDAKKDAARMRTVYNLLNRVQDEYYGCEYQSYYDQDFNIGPDGLLEWLEPVNDNLGQYFDKYPGAYKYAIERLKTSSKYEVTRVTIALTMGDYLQAKARRIAYKMISNYSPGWWD